MKKRTALGLLLACAAVAEAQGIEAREPPPTEDRKVQAWRDYQARVVDALAETGGARELAFAALLRTSVGSGEPDDVEVATWREAAAARGGDDVLVNRLLAVDGGAGRALRAQAARRWRSAEPDNFVPLMQLGLPMDEVLEQARGAGRSHSHMYDTVRWMQSALLRHPPTADEEAAIADDEPVGAVEISLLLAMNTWTTYAMLPYQSLVEACSGDALQATLARQADCRHVATLLADHSDGMADGGIGLAMLHRLAASDFEREDIEVRRRRMDWQGQQLAVIAAEDGNASVARLVGLLADPSIEGDAQMLERALLEAGIPLDPPVGWQSLRLRQD